MEKMNDLRDLLKHEIYDLHSAEEQIIKALPAMIQKVNNSQLKITLEEHLQVTQKHLLRLEEVQIFLDGGSENATEKKGLLARLFKRHHVCRGMQGLIEEGEKVMAEQMSPEVLDAAIIACSQKIEHYEICAYGTARAFAMELNLMEIGQLLEETLNEGYEADDRLTALAVARLNEKAEQASGIKNMPAKDEAPSQNGNSSKHREMPVERAKKEIEPELVSQQTDSIQNKKIPTRNKAPKGELERSENPRLPSSEKRAAANSGNSKAAKSATRRKATDGRTNSVKTKRDR